MVEGWRGSNCVIIPNVVAIDQTVSEIWKFFDYYHVQMMSSCSARSCRCQRCRYVHPTHCCQGCSREWRRSYMSLQGTGLGQGRSFRLLALLCAWCSIVVSQTPAHLTPILRLTPPFPLYFYSAPQCSHCKLCTSYGNSVRLSVCHTPLLFQNDGT